MIIFIVLGAVVLLALGILGFLFYLLNKESKTKESVVPVAFGQLTKPAQSFPEVSIKKPQEVPVLFDIPSKEAEEVIRISREFEEKEVVHQRRVLELEGELNAIAQKAQDQSQEALEAMERLRQENEELKKEQGVNLTTATEQIKKENEQYKEDQEKRVLIANESLVKVQDLVDTMRQEQSGLQSRLSDSQEQVQKLQEEVVVIRQQMSQEIIQGKVESEKLMIENQSLQSTRDAAIAEIAKGFQEQISALKEENQKLKDAHQEVIESSKNIKEMNIHLIEKSEALQWELTKARAQTTSLERACENYKLQLKEVLEQQEKG